MSGNAKKTNAVRIAENSGCKVRIYEYDVSDGAIDALSIAEKTGEAPERVFKTLVTVSPDKEHFVFVVPSSGELDLKLAAKAAGKKSLAMIPQKELFPLTGYVHGGCSPLGMKKLFPTWIDETAILFDYICFSGGRIGTSIAMAPDDAAKLIPAKFAPLGR